MNALKSSAATAIALVVTSGLGSAQEPPLVAGLKAPRGLTVDGGWFPGIVVIAGQH